MALLEQRLATRDVLVPSTGGRFPPGDGAFVVQAVGAEIHARLIVEPRLVRVAVDDVAVDAGAERAITEGLERGGILLPFANHRGVGLGPGDGFLIGVGDGCGNLAVRVDERAVLPELADGDVHHAVVVDRIAMGHLRAGGLRLIENAHAVADVAQLLEEVRLDEVRPSVAHIPEEAVGLHAAADRRATGEHRQVGRGIVAAQAAETFGKTRGPRLRTDFPAIGVDRMDRTGSGGLQAVDQLAAEGIDVVVHR